MSELRVQIPDELAERLAIEAAERHMAPEEVVADMIDHNIPARRRLRFIGIGHSGQHDNARRAEEVLEEHFAS